MRTSYHRMIHPKFLSIQGILVIRQSAATRVNPLIFRMVIAFQLGVQPSTNAHRGSELFSRNLCVSFYSSSSIAIRTGRAGMILWFAFEVPTAANIRIFEYLHRIFHRNCVSIGRSAMDKCQSRFWVQFSSIQFNSSVRDGYRFPPRGGGGVGLLASITF